MNKVLGIAESIIRGIENGDELAAQPFWNGTYMIRSDLSALVMNLTNQRQQCAITYLLSVTISSS